MYVVAVVAAPEAAVVAAVAAADQHFRLYWCLAKGWQMLGVVWRLDLKLKAWRVCSSDAMQAKPLPEK